MREIRYIDEELFNDKGLCWEYEKYSRNVIGSGKIRFYIYILLK